MRFRSLCSRSASPSIRDPEKRVGLVVARAVSAAVLLSIGQTAASAQAPHWCDTKGPDTLGQFLVCFDTPAPGTKGLLDKDKMAAKLYALLGGDGGASPGLKAQYTYFLKLRDEAKDKATLDTLYDLTTKKFIELVTALPPAPPKQPTPKKVTHPTGEMVTVYDKPNGVSQGLIPSGETVMVTVKPPSRAGGTVWQEINYDSKTGWVDYQYFFPGGAKPGGTVSKILKDENDGVIFIYEQANTDNFVTTVPSGAAVILTATPPKYSGDTFWQEVTYGQQKGWVEVRYFQ
ncbi:MAG: hypothetical protein SFW09_04775 [Hyphomicrobiaceae bacterium]|nr:hypothetical protein [Hyphomicrobiaceae bacterium]